MLWLIKITYWVRWHSKTIEFPWMSFLMIIAAHLIFDFRSSMKMSAFIYYTWNYVRMFYTARTKSCQIFAEFKSVTMEIHEPKVNLKLQKQQNLGKFLIFDVFCSTLNFYHHYKYLRIDFWPILQHNTHHWLAFLCSTRPQMAQESQTKLHKFHDLSWNFAKKNSISIAIFSKKKKDIWLFR
jgi:hypothetical protein